MNLVKRTPQIFAALMSVSMLYIAPVMAQDTAQIDYGTNAGEWANNGICDDPRFEGAGMASELVGADHMRDAADCEILLLKGQITYRSTTLSKGFDFGDDTSEWANDAQCDDPRFEGPHAAVVLLEEDNGHDASDCKTLFQTGQINRAPGGGTTRVNFGDNASQWANDGECDDSRFEGTSMSQTFADVDIAHDANDCSTLYYQEKIDFAGG